MVVVFYLPFKNHLLVAAVIFTVAAITDWFDGYLARKLGQMTAFGISGKQAMSALFMTHPPLETRIAALRAAGS